MQPCLAFPLQTSPDSASWEADVCRYEPPLPLLQVAEILSMSVSHFDLVMKWALLAMIMFYF